MCEPAGAIPADQWWRRRAHAAGPGAAARRGAVAGVVWRDAGIDDAGVGRSGHHHSNIVVVIDIAGHLAYAA